MRLALVARGIVQGVGFRPFVRRAALSCGLTGWVRNERGAVRIEVQGPPDALDTFERLLRTELPKPAHVRELSRHPLPECVDALGFRILASEQTDVVAAVLPPDLATCSACWADVFRLGDRRNQYPFTTCAACGPRYAITLSLPYDRQSTTMRNFQHCEACAREYEDLDDRRYHAQASACPTCGPQLLWSDGAASDKGTGALSRAVERLQQGYVVALQGLGGFQLLTSATDDVAIHRLRQRKQRPHKPFAVMFRDLSQLERHADVSEVERRLLVSAQAPIVLLQRRADSTLSDAVSPELASLGAMLPYTPLHGLLLQATGGPLVCTSGNRHTEPLCTTAEEARERLASVADGILHHDRPIARPVDDSVVRKVNVGCLILRRARGYAPLAAARVEHLGCVLGVGAHHKSTVALSHDGSVIVSQHLGDLDSQATRQLLERTVDDLCRFFRATPTAIACDLHPEYPSTSFAEQLAGRLNVPIVRVQHHHAHIAAVMAEYRLEGDVLGLAWDGTGFGLDGTVWGGEALRCAGSTFTRIAHLERFPLPGGERAVREPRRAALGLLSVALPDQVERRTYPWFGTQLPLLRSALQRGLNAPSCSSIGRLFDAVAALIDVADFCTFEGQAAMRLEQLAGSTRPDGAYELPLHAGPDGTWSADPRYLLEDLLADKDRGVPTPKIARRFHEALIGLGVAMAELASAEQVVLGGGCFQNRLLLDGLSARLINAGHRPFIPREVPPNDGGLSLGQVYVAAQLLAH